MIKDKLIDILLDGLFFDGSHHKQHYIYQALVEVVGSEEEIYKIRAEETNMTVEEYIEEYGEIDKGCPA